jgi:hypothetical protein
MAKKASVVTALTTAAKLIDQIGATDDFTVNHPLLSTEKAHGVVDAAIAGLQKVKAGLNTTVPAASKPPAKK